MQERPRSHGRSHGMCVCVVLLCEEEHRLNSVQCPREKDSLQPCRHLWPASSLTMQHDEMPRTGGLVSLAAAGSHTETQLLYIDAPCALQGLSQCVSWRLCAVCARPMCVCGGPWCLSGLLRRYGCRVRAVWG